MTRPGAPAAIVDWLATLATRAEIANVRAETKADIAALRTELKAAPAAGPPALDRALSYTLPGAAAATGLSRKQLDELVRSRTVKSFRYGRRQFVDADSLRQWIAAQVAAEAPLQRSPARAGRGLFAKPQEGPAPRPKRRPAARRPRQASLDSGDAIPST